jgi:hypothetical protein
MKAAITEWMKANLGLTLNQEKTHHALAGETTLSGL